MPHTKKVKIDFDESNESGYVYYVVYVNEVTGQETIAPLAFGFPQHVLGYYKKAIIGDWNTIPGMGYRGISRDSDYTHVCIRGLIFLGPKALNGEESDEARSSDD